VCMQQACPLCIGAPCCKSSTECGCSLFGIPSFCG
jgi:hypothetical protein